MSKFLKIIVNLVIVVAIAVAAALLIPPFAGVHTVMSDNTETDTNLPIGSVAYGTSADASELEAGDRIIYSEGSRDYIYEITDIDQDTHRYTVKDVYDNNSDTETVTIRSSIPKVVLVLPLIGYAAIALQTTVGLIVAGAAIVVLIILFILSEILRKDRKGWSEEDEAEEESEPEMETETLEEPEDQTEELDKEETEEDESAAEPEEEEVSEEEDPSYQSEETEDTEGSDPLEGSEDDDYDQAIMEAMYSAAKERAQVSEPEQVPDATIILPDVQEMEESSLGVQEDMVIRDSYGPETEVLASESEAAEEDENISADDEKTEAAEEPAEDTEETPDTTEIEESAGEEEESEEADREEESEILEEIPEPEEEEEVVNPEAVLGSPTVEELLEKAREAGDEPEIKEDKDNQVTLLDYSKIL